MASVVDSSLDAAAQDFSWVVRSARQLYLEGNQTCNGAKIQLSEPVYGRICSSRKAEPPIKLTTNLSRKTAFIFGSDAIASIVLQNNAYDTLRRLGFTPDYLHYDHVVQKCSSWLFLFKPTACGRDDFLVAPATWDGVESVLRTLYPDVLQDFTSHRQQLEEANYESFEQEAGFKFLESKKAQDGATPGPPYYTYERFRSLPHPRRAWQVRLFLYCELRLLELYSGDGLTYMEDGTPGCLEYFCTNVSIADFEPTQSALIPLDVQIPLTVTKYIQERENEQHDFAYTPCM